MEIIQPSLGTEHADCLRNNTGQCSSCMDLRLIFDPSNSTIVAKPCTQCLNENSYDLLKSINDIADAINYSEIPSRYVSACQSPVSPSEVMEWINRIFEENHRGSLALFGGAGSGKTHSAVTVLIEFAKRGFSTKYVNCTDYLSAVKENFAMAKNAEKNNRSFNDWIRHIKDCLSSTDVVVIDDLGVGKPTDFSRSIWEEIVCTRYDSGKLTIYNSTHSKTSEAGSDEKTLDQLIGSRALSRVNEATAVKLTGNDSIKKDEKSDVDGRSPVPKLTDDEVTSIHIFSRDGIFRVLSNGERSSLTKPSVKKPGELLDIPVVREFDSWSGSRVVVSGPVVDYGDANVLFAIIKSHHDSGFEGEVTITTLLKICSSLNLKKSGANYKMIKRSIIRLQNVAIEVDSKDHDKVWAGHIIDEAEFIGKGKGSRIKIRFNTHMLQHYKRFSFSKFNLPLLTSLSIYAQGIYRFLASQRDDYKFIGLDKWRSLLGVNESIKSKHFKYRFMKAITELVDDGILLRESNIDDREVVHTYRSKLN